MSLSHCVWLWKASTVSVPGGLARSSICRVHYKPTFPLSSSMHRCRPFNQVSNSCNTLTVRPSNSTVWLDFQRAMGKNSLGRNNSWTVGLRSLFSCFACISCFYVSLTCWAFIGSQYLGNVRYVVLMPYKACVRNNDTKNPVRLFFKWWGVTFLCLHFMWYDLYRADATWHS